MPVAEREISFDTGGQVLVRLVVGVWERTSSRMPYLHVILACKMGVLPTTFVTVSTPPQVLCSRTGPLPYPIGDSLPLSPLAPSPLAYSF